MSSKQSAKTKSRIQAAERRAAKALAELREARNCTRTAKLEAELGDVRSHIDDRAITLAWLSTEAEMIRSFADQVIAASTAYSIQGDSAQVAVEALIIDRDGLRERVAELETALANARRSSARQLVELHVAKAPRPPVWAIEFVRVAAQRGEATQTELDAFYKRITAWVRDAAKVSAAGAARRLSV